jgi:hypothetical protein
MPAQVERSPANRCDPDDRPPLGNLSWRKTGSAHTQDISLAICSQKHSLLEEQAVALRPVLWFPPADSMLALQKTAFPRGATDVGLAQLVETTWRFTASDRVFATTLPERTGKPVTTRLHSRPTAPHSP